MNMRTVSTALGITASALALSVSGVVAAQQITLRIGMDEGKTPAKSLAVLAQSFEAAHPDIQIEWVKNYGPNVAKLATEVAGGVAPDIIGGWNGLPEVAAQNGLLLDLNPYIQRDHAQDLISDLLPSYLASMTINGHLYALPQYTWVGGMYYNRSMFDQFGLATPSDTWSWSTFSSYAQKLTQTDASGKVTVVGATMPYKWLWLFPWLEAAGANFADPNHVDLASDGVINATTFLQGLYKQGWLQLAYSGPFVGGKAAMLDDGSYTAKGMVSAAAAGLSIGVVPIPAGPVAQLNMTNDDSYAISRSTRHPDQAWVFLKWFYSKPVQEQYMKTFGLQPARLSLGLQWAEAVNQLFRTGSAPLISGLDTFITQSANARSQPVYSDETVVANYIQPALNDVIQKGKPAAATLKAASEAANAYLQSHAKKSG